MKEQYFRDFFKKSPTAYSYHRVILDEQGNPYDYRFLEVNEAFENIMGLKASDVIGKRLYEVFPSDWKEGARWDKAFKEVFMNKSTVNVDMHYNWIDKWMRVQVFPLDECCFSCIFTDITKEYMQEKEIEGFLKVNLDMLCVSDTDGRFLKVNKAFEDVLGYNVHELEGKCFLSMVHEDDLSATLSTLRASEEQKPVSGFMNRYRCKDGSYKSLEWRSRSNGKYIYASARDVTEKLKAEAELLVNAQNELITKIIENLDMPFTRCTYPDFDIIHINNKAYNLLKGVNREIIPLSCMPGQNIFQFLYSQEKDQLIYGIENSLSTNSSSYSVDRKYILDGEEKFLKSIYQPLVGLDNKITEIVILEVDVTEEVRAINEMEKTLKVQDEIFANVSHELKTPLNMIFSTNQLVELYLKNNLLEDNKDKILNSLGIIRQNCYRFTKLINNIVDASKIDSGFYKLNLSNVNIVEIVEDIVQSVAAYVNQKSISIVFDTSTEEKVIACDPEKIERIILNLISNGVKFTNPGGHIFVNVNDKGDSVEISVSDTGIGMSQKYLDKIFKRFHQIDKSLSRNAEGSGIGLSLVKSIVEIHGGKITVESSPGEGSEFKIELPARTAEGAEIIKKIKHMDDKIEIINVEFSDIYSL